ncbi:hypothetical protein DFH07DRAFT_809654 [Mycena maculata]|uniref:BTB domain-containing protein n=1 Tax=Mycena maculata TaxID=230809 RepID=A0AAD7JN14_9AGAR|nr:hypothetical protein DFH07DRAFT_809654 [Mycena maculata]
MSVVPVDISHETPDLQMDPENGRTASEPQIDRNNKYYLDDPMAIFLVGNQHFKVHRHFLEKGSEVFHSMFMCPADSSGPDGFTDDRAIPLSGVTSMEFETLLDYFYDEKFQRYQSTMEQWIDLLAISTRFNFEKIRNYAIDAIEYSRWPAERSRKSTIGSIDQIVLAEKHDIPHWLPNAYALICERGSPLEEWEAEKIGYRTTTLLARAREAVRNRHHKIPTPVPSPPPSSLGLDSPALSVFSLREPDSNEFSHNRARVEAIVSEVFFPAGNAG